MRGWPSADSGNFASRSWPDGNGSAFTTSSRSLPTVGRGVLTAVITARFITSIKEPEALTFNSSAWFGGARSFLARVTMCIFRLGRNG
jgi:hypothetical protein